MPHQPDPIDRSKLILTTVPPLGLNLSYARWSQIEKEKEKLYEPHMISTYCPLYI